MKINNKNLIGLRVESESGEALGILESFNLETESQSVLEYVVKPESKILDLIKSDLIIPRGQIVDITNEKIIVNDLFLKDKDNSKQKISEKVKTKIPSGAIMKKWKWITF